MLKSACCWSTKQGKFCDDTFCMEYEFRRIRMNRLQLLLASILLLAASFAIADENNPDDLRYCLELQSNYDIAKCAGEVSAGSKGRPYTKEEVDKLLSEQQARAPDRPDEPKEIPDTEVPVKDMLMEQEEATKN